MLRFWIAATCILTTSAEQPNIVMLLADDMGFGDVGFTGGEIPTPNIDAFASSGVVLKNFYVQPACTPSRTALLTGRYPSRLGMQGVPLSAGSMEGLSLDEKLLPEYLQELGYETHLVGKWHLGFAKKEYLPTRRGFDTFFGFLSGFLGYYDGIHLELNKAGIDARRNETKSWHELVGRYLPEVLSNEAVSVIRRHEADPHKKPFFLLVSTNAPHTGNSRMDLEPAKEQSPLTSSVQPRLRKMYADVVEYVDQTLADIVTALEESDLLSNTIVIFTSDNGAPTVDLQWGYENHGSNNPFRGIKMSLHEGGVRAPAVIWSRQLANHSGIYPGLFHLSDMLPTLVAAAGGQVNDDTLDGVNQWSALMGGTKPRDHVLVDVQVDEETEAIVFNEHKLIKNFKDTSRFAFTDKFYGRPLGTCYDKGLILDSKVAAILGGVTEAKVADIRSTFKQMKRCPKLLQEKAEEVDCASRYCLYNLTWDPSECYDIAEQNPSVVAELKMKLEKLKEKGIKHNARSSARYEPNDNYWGPIEESSCFII